MAMYVSVALGDTVELFSWARGIWRYVGLAICMMTLSFFRSFLVHDFGVVSLQLCAGNDWQLHCHLA